VAFPPKSAGKKPNPFAKKPNPFAKKAPMAVKKAPPKGRKPDADGDFDAPPVAGYKRGGKVK
jgi:hypothetical protein